MHAKPTAACTKWYLGLNAVISQQEDLQSCIRLPAELLSNKLPCMASIKS